MDFKQTLNLLEAARVKKVHFTFRKKVPSDTEVWRAIEKQEHLTVDDVTLNGNQCTIDIEGYWSGGNPVQDFIDWFSSKFNAKAGK